MKKYIIDGHNLIPKIPGLSLSDPDDEVKLIERVNHFCRLTRSYAELFFDHAAQGHAGIKAGGLVRVHFIHQGSDADTAIKIFIENQGAKAAQFIVVSSDQQLRSAAKLRGTPFLTSEEFSSKMQQVFARPEAEESLRNAPLSPSDLADWEDFFNSDHPT
jgi:uncharacterized protein